MRRGNGRHARRRPYRRALKCQRRGLWQDGRRGRGEIRSRRLRFSRDIDADTGDAEAPLKGSRPRTRAIEMYNAAKITGELHRLIEQSTA